MTLHIENFDERLIEEARRKAGVDSDEAAVKKALEQYVGTNPPGKRTIPGGLVGNPEDIFELFGTVDFDPDWDYKERRRQDSLKRIPKDDDC
jgi:hypothetical protein